MAHGASRREPRLAVRTRRAIPLALRLCAVGCECPAPIAIVTGGSRGIGAATVDVLAEQGWDVCLTYLSDSNAAANVVARCFTRGRRAIAVQADVANERDVLDVFERVDRDLGPISALVNNAGIVAPVSRVDEMDHSRLQRMMAVNVIGPFLCSREAVRRMSIRHGGVGGAIVNVSSAAARLGSPGEYVDYAASKAAIDALTIGLAREVADEEVSVTAVRPGVIDTEIHATGGRPRRAQQLGPGLPMKRSGRPLEVAETIAWLCSRRAPYATGAVLDVSGAL
jgi:NAD(P)-dependent dehydrogenase (short-subunit alcohol dehydrogenase family)